MGLWVLLCTQSLRRGQEYHIWPKVGRGNFRWKSELLANVHKHLPVPTIAWCPVSGFVVVFLGFFCPSQMNVVINRLLGPGGKKLVAVLLLWTAATKLLRTWLYLQGWRCFSHSPPTYALHWPPASSAQMCVALRQDGLLAARPKPPLPREKERECTFHKDDSLELRALRKL